MTTVPHIYVFNGDADGLGALQQLRLAEPLARRAASPPPAGAGLPLSRGRGAQQGRAWGQSPPLPWERGPGGEVAQGASDCAAITGAS